MNRIIGHVPHSVPRERQSETPAVATTKESALLTTQEAADYLRLSARTLERYRVDGTGPAFTKIGPGLRSRVVYRHEDLETWLARFQYSSTSEYR